MRRREVLGALGGVAVGLPLAARAEQRTTAIGFLGAASAAGWVPLIAGFRQGLKDTGFIDGQNVLIEYRWAEGHYDQLPKLAADLVNQNVAVILAAGGSDPAKAAKAATAKIPIVFVSAADPIKTGIVTSLNRPEANVTGVSLLGAALEAKRLGLLHEISPGAASIGILVNPNYPDADFQLKELQEAASVMKLPINVVRASTETEIELAISSVAQQGAGALLVAQDPYFTSRREQLAALTVRYKLPAIYSFRDFPDAGGLMSYGTNFAESFRQAGVYVGRILKGEKTGDLPVLQPTKFELVINLKAAKMIGLTIPNAMQLLADEVIE